MAEAIRQGDIPGVQLRVRQPLALPADAALVWLDEPERLVRWLADRIETSEGDQVLRLHHGPADRPQVEEARLLERDACLRRYRFQRLGDGWDGTTRLTLELVPRDAACELSVLHEGFQNLPLSRGLTIWEAYRRRWREAVARLALAVGG